MATNSLAKAKLFQIMTDRYWQRQFTQDPLSNPLVWHDTHPVLKQLIREWLGAMTKPTKTIGYKWTLDSINWWFKHQTMMYSVSGMMLGALLETEYQMAIKSCSPCFNCTVMKLPKQPRHLPDWLKYHKIAPIYSEWVIPDGQGYWLPELYTNLDELKSKYRQPQTTKL